MSQIDLIIEADEPALFFSSIKAAEKYLEAIDIKNGVYKSALGPSGEVYSLKIKGNTVSIIREHSQKLQPEKLRSILLVFLKEIGVQPLEAETLSELLVRCLPHITK